MPRLEEQSVSKIVTWKDFATIKKWKKSLKQDADFGELTKGTEHAIDYWMPPFLESTKSTEKPEGLNPDELIEEALMDPQIIKDRLSDCFSWCKKNLPNRSYNSIVTGVYGVDRGFYSHNMPAMPKIRTPKLLPRHVHKADTNFPLTIIVEADMGNAIITKTIQLNRELFREEILSRLNLRDQAITLVSISGGMDSGDTLGLNMELLRNQEQFERIFILDYRSKTGESINTFWSKEATKKVRKYAKLERKNADNSEPIFISDLKSRKKAFMKKYGREFKNDDILPLGNRFTAKHYAVNLRKIAEDLGIPLIKNQQSPLRPKRWRKLFSDACDNAKIGDNKRKIFMGKADKTNKVYSGHARHELEIYYEMVEPHVTIYTEIQNTADLSKIQKDMKEIKLKQMRHEIADKAENESLQEKIKELEEKLKKS